LCRDEENPLGVPRHIGKRGARLRRISFGGF
jgi:hypothetical protein